MRARDWIRFERPDIALGLGAIVVSLVIFAATFWSHDSLREETLQSVEGHVRSQAVVLAEEGGRAFKALDVVLAELGDELARTMARERTDLAEVAKGRRLHELLADRKAALSHVDAIAVVGSDGRLVNSSRHWPVPAIDVSGRDYFSALRGGAAAQVFVSAPAQNSATGAWTIYLARRVTGPEGEFAGLIHGAITLEYFESFFRSIALQEGSAIALMRSDGMLLARYPQPKGVGKVIPAAATPGGSQTLAVRRVESPVDGQRRVVAIKALSTYPLAIVASMSEASALRSWQAFAERSTTMALMRTIFVLLMAYAACRWWRSQCRLHEALRVQNLRFDTAVENMGSGLCMFDGEKRLVVCNKRYADLYRLPPALSQPGTRFHDIITHRIQAGILRGQTDGTAVTEKLAALEEVPADRASNRIEALADGRLVCVIRQPMAGGGWVATHEDVTDRERLNTQLQAIVDNFPGGIALFDADLNMSVCNDRAKVLLDLPSDLFTQATTPLEKLVRFNACRGEFGPGDVEQQVSERLALARSREAYEFERERPTGTVLNESGVPLADGGFLTTYTDMTERHRAEARIAHMALHDELTGLANRASLRQQLAQAIAATRTGAMYALHMLDLDRFKEVNDTLGHPVGDALLKAVAQRLRACVKEADVTARLGGDELCVIQALSGATDEAAILADSIVEALAAPFDLDGHRVYTSASVGIVVLDDRQCADADQLLNRADLALYRAKSDGRSRFRFFEAEMDAHMQSRRALERDLREALAREEFELVYQPLLDLGRDRICGFETLLRWNHPTRGMISPMDFIPVAEEIGLISPIGDWVIRRACSEAAAWPSDLKLAINLSPAQLKGRPLVQSVVGALAASGLAAGRLELEITETMMLEDAEETLVTLSQLRRLNVRIALDDFGTGYSSLTNLRTFPFDRIKIDRGFVADLGEESGDVVAIVRSILQLGSSLGKQTTAEGVETAAQLDFLRAEGCTEVQGYWVSKPIPAAQVENFLAAPRTRVA